MVQTISLGNRCHFFFLRVPDEPSFPSCFRHSFYMKIKIHFLKGLVHNESYNNSFISTSISLLTHDRCSQSSVMCQIDRAYAESIPSAPRPPL